ncbi:MAG: ATP-grasp domain-containing protein, partial [Lachnospiraceae bacterium]|nr:ATP-grasp domain-containing protein [Lachnospiraceae bacterium]
KTDEIKKHLDKYILVTHKLSSTLKVALVSSVQNETKTRKDFPSEYNSIITSYMSRKDIDELIFLFHENGIYVELFSDIDKFFKQFYSDDWKCNAVFETSPQGIAKGKDAIIPAFCDTVGLLHFGSNAAANLRVGNKYNWYCVLKQNSIPVPETFFYNNGWNVHPKCFPILLKLNEECASVGLSQNSLIKSDFELLNHQAQKLQAAYNEPIIGQQFIHGYEAEVPIINNEAETLILPAVGLSRNGQKLLGDYFFDYDTIFDDGYGVYSFDDNSELTNKLFSICDRIIKILDLQGHFRIDFRISENGNPYVTDINNDPTIGWGSSFLYSIKSLGYTEKDLLAIILGSYLVNQTSIECL